MQEIRGKFANSVRYIHGGYEYHIDTTSPHLFRCSMRQTTQCQGVVEVTGQRPRQQVHVRTPHDVHQPNPTIFQEATMRQEMIDLALQTNDPPKSIFDAVCARNPVDIARRLRYPPAKNAIDRARTKILPPIPASLSDLAVFLDTYVPTENIYRGSVEGVDGNIALLFISDEMLEVLGTATEIYIDGTFKVAPSRPRIVQLYTVHVRVMDTGLAGVFVLSNARTRALYEAIFQKIIELAPGIAGTLQFVMGDYERAAMSAIQYVFPRARLHGCWFHFNQALVRRWRSLGLLRAPRRILTLAMALPLAPAANFEEGLRLLERLGDAIAVEHRPILDFLHYMRRHWGPLAEVVSVHGCPVRTNNLVESFHNEAKRKLGGLHPNIWKFIDNLKQTIINQGLDLARLQDGLRPRQPRTLKNMARDTTIRDAQHDFRVGRLTLIEFLQRYATRVPEAHGRQPGYDAVGEEDVAGLEELEDLFPPGLLALGNPQVDEQVRPGRGRGRRARLNDEEMEIVAEQELVLENPNEPEPEGLPEEEVEYVAHIRGRGRARAERRARGRPRGRRAGRIGRNRPGLHELDEPEPEILLAEEAENVPRVPVRGRARAGRRARGRPRGRRAGQVAENEPALDDPDNPEPVDERVNQLVGGIDELVQAALPARAPAQAPAPAEDQAPALGQAPAPAEGQAPAPAQDQAPEPAEGQAPAPALLQARAPTAERRPGHNICCFCMEVAPTHAYIPCGHKCCCANCIVRWPNHCPLCQTKSSGVIYIRSP